MVWSRESSNREMASLTVADTSESLDVANHALTRPFSAIATFSNLISSMNSNRVSTRHNSIITLAVCTTSKPRLASVGLGALPTEILMSIFDFVFEMCVDWHRTGTVHPKHAMAWTEDDPLSPTLFPYSLASVCVRWLHILSSVAVYWTRQVVTADSRAASLVAIQAPLQWVGNLPLQLIVTRHPEISAEVDRGELARVQAVLDLIQPRIHQIWSLTFNVKGSFSLPELSEGQGDAQHLAVLSPMSGHSDAGSMTGRSRLPGLHHARNCNGHDQSLRANFAEEVAFDSGRFMLVFGDQRNLWFCNIAFLTIHGCNGIRISLHQFITAIQTCGLLQKLTVENITFVNDVHPSRRFHLEAPVVCLRNIADGDAVAAILSQALGTRLKEVVRVAGCPFDGFGKRSSLRRRIPSTSLILEGMNSSDVGIQQLVCFWNGEDLSLVNCPGVSASFLRGVPTEEMPSNLRRLRIVDCGNAGAEGLIALVRSRELQSAIDALIPSGRDESCTQLVELCVQGRGVCISTEQATWLADHVDIFDWDTVAGDGVRYTWDASARRLIVLPA